MATYDPAIIFEGLKALKHKECTEQKGSCLDLIIRVLEVGLSQRDIDNISIDEIDEAMELIHEHQYSSDDNILTSLQDVSMLKSMLYDYTPKKRIVCDTDFF